VVVSLAIVLAGTAGAVIARSGEDRPAPENAAIGRRDLTESSTTTTAPATPGPAATGPVTSAATSTTTTTVAPSTTTNPPATTTTPPATTTTPPATTSPAPPPTPAPASGPRCVVRLHGKGGDGAPTWVADDVHYLSPAGNAPGWGARQWLYTTDTTYRQARDLVAGAIAREGCGQVIVDGFSNGGAFAAKLYCRGETFDNRLVGVVADDPVPDHAVEGCRPASSVRLTLYWTGALDDTATPGWNCAQQDWTCEGGTTIGIDAYQANLHTTHKNSPYSEHQWYDDAPELTAFH
jgi:hypothetical protein